MSICSYIVYPVQEKLNELKKKLNALSSCEVITSKNRDVLILVTETHSDLEEQELQNRLTKIEEIQCLALTFGNIE